MRLITSLGNAVLLIAGIAALAFAKPVRKWADHHGIVLYVVALVLLVIVLVLLERWLDVRARYPRITHRDRELFARFESEFPRGTGEMYFLEAFNGKRWTWRDLRRVATFADNWGHTEYFDDKRMEAAREAFHVAARDFHNDAAGESAPHEESDDVEEVSVHRPEQNGATYQEYAAVQQRLRMKARAVAQAYEDLYRLGRKRGF